MKSPRARTPIFLGSNPLSLIAKRPTGNYLRVLITRLPAFEARRELGSRFAMSRQELSIRIVAGFSQAIDREELLVTEVRFELTTFGL